jgi:hypothetical protein
MLALVLFAVPESALGQGQSLHDVRNQLREGDRVRIVDISRTPTTGRLGSLSADSFVVHERGRTVTISDSRVYLIQVPRREGDGVLIGMGIGATAGLIVARLDCRDSSEHGDCIRAATLYLGGGMAALGALVDHLFKRYNSVFDRTTTGNTIRVAPLLSTRRRGLTLRIAF